MPASGYGVSSWSDGSILKLDIVVMVAHSVNIPLTCKLRKGEFSGM